MHQAGRPRLIDCTLREGTQAPGVVFDAGQSARITALLVAAGIDMIECGHAGVSAAERRRIGTTVAAAGPVPVLTHARARRDDVDAAVDTGASWVGIFLGCNEFTRRAKVVGAGMDDLLAMIHDAVAHAVRQGLRVRFTVEDASRTDDPLLGRAYSTAVTAGAHRLAFADTVGVLEPPGTTATARWLRTRFPDREHEFHLHDDRGLAMANALAATDGGAGWISCSVNGLGERAGITDTFLYLANLHFRGVRPLADVAALRELSEFVAGVSRVAVDPLRPVVGQNAFTHTAALHQRAVRRDPMAYSWLDPAVLGARTAFAPPVGSGDRVLSPSCGHQDEEQAK